MDRQRVMLKRKQIAPSLSFPVSNHRKWTCSMIGYVFNVIHELGSGFGGIGVGT